VIPYLLLSGLVPGIEHLSREAALARHNPLPVLTLLMLPTTAIGALLPLAIRMLDRAGRGAATRGAATLYALNTVGAIVGSVAAGFLLIPALGLAAPSPPLSTLALRSRER